MNARQEAKFKMQRTVEHQFDENPTIVAEVAAFQSCQRHRRAAQRAGGKPRHCRAADEADGEVCGRWPQHAGSAAEKCGCG